MRIMKSFKNIKKKLEKKREEKTSPLLSSPASIRR
jgi:hypothetical protein